MDVLVGHFQDPEEFPGLAHFCGTVSALRSTARRALCGELHLATDYCSVAEADGWPLHQSTCCSWARPSTPMRTPIPVSFRLTAARPTPTRRPRYPQSHHMPRSWGRSLVD